MTAIAQIQLNTGQKVSAILHGGLIAWIMLFDLFAAPEDQLIPEVTEVALISAQDFAEMMQPATAVEPAEPIVPLQPAPPPQPVAPITPPEPIVPPQPVVPEPVAPVVAPEPIAPPPPPVPEPPQAAVIAPQVAPDASLTPVQRPAERVAPEAAPTPDPQVQTALVDQAAITPDASATVDAQEAQEATQRDAAATETVTEVTTISETEPVRRTATAPEVSLRPRRRPATPEPVEAVQPVPASRPELTFAPDAPVDETPVADGPSADAIEDALAAAIFGALDEAASATLSQADIDILRLNIEACWNVGILSTEALGVVITLGFEMTPDARPIESSIYQVSAQGGGLAAQLAAFDAGRQAIVQCGINGFGLPPDLYDQWRLVEITFNPARMITR